MTASVVLVGRVQTLNEVMRAENWLPFFYNERVQLIVEGDAKCPRYAVLMRVPPSPGAENCVGLSFVASIAAAHDRIAEYADTGWECEVVLDLDLRTRWKPDADGTLRYGNPARF